MSATAHGEPVAPGARGPLYESHYLKANSRDGERAIWIKHTAMLPAEGEAVLELWAMALRRGEPPDIARHDLPLQRVSMGPGPSIAAEGLVLEPARAEGSLADFSWSLALSGGLGAIAHLPWSWLYDARAPTAKVATQASCLRFDGELRFAGNRWDLDGWVGLRGHNWGRRHTWRYAWLAANLWEDGAERALEGFTARPGPWAPQLARALLRERSGPGGKWLGPGRWPSEEPPVCWAQGWRGLVLRAEADPDDFVRLAYRQPEGGKALCRCTKFARVEVELGDARLLSRCGELEFIDQAAPLEGPTHPPASWSAADGPYRS